ncbi:efflux RND transporter periplasmic adaptor subunit [Myxococcota bacterium]|nr:efflux RND transporter periplasmic adaptor subunit [Myxococcota bacterium]
MKTLGLLLLNYLLTGIVLAGCNTAASSSSGPASGKEHAAEGSHEAGEGGHAEEVVRLSESEMKEFGITLAEATGGVIERVMEFPGEIVLNADRLAHVVPRVGGVVREVRKNVGDRVDAGDVLATLDSRELAEAKARFLAAVEREELARSSSGREKKLRDLQVNSEQDYLDARQAMSLASIARRTAQQQLAALGFSEKEMQSLASGGRTSLTLYTMVAPFSGTIIEKHLTLGENVGTDTAAFSIADLSSVWVDMNVYQKDLPELRQEQSVTIDAGRGIAPVPGKIAWVSPRLDRVTRTAKARVVLQNPSGSLRPGLFVMARVAVGGGRPSVVVVPAGALQSFEGRTVVFVQTGRGLEPQPVEVGRRNDTGVEILSGLARGQVYVRSGSFTVKAQLSKGALGDGHNH